MIDKGSSKSSIPLYVDLDGTLIKSDILWESILILIKSKPWLIFLLPFILFKGKAGFKTWIAHKVDLDISVLPYHKPFLQFLKKQNRPLILATASHIKFADLIANHLGIFDAVMASSDDLNLSGTAKLNKIQTKHKKFGYAGNAKIDCKVWNQAQEVVMVNAPNQLKAKYPNALVFDDRINLFKALLKGIRIHQWAKNFLIFIPMIMSHNIFHLGYLLNTVMAFLAFSLCASSVYLLNDLLDLESDRHHIKKQKRPLASGNLPISIGVFTIPILLGLSAGISWLLPTTFQLVLFIYFIITTAYSFLLKSIALIDIIVLATLYTIRIIAGGAANDIPNTNWLLAFSFFLFTSLAFVKRFSELKMMKQNTSSKVKGRGYYVDDLEQISSFGTTSGYLSVLVFAFYLDSAHAKELYHNAQILWLLCPVFLYWISRIWLLARRGKMIEDPVKFAITDSRTYAVFIIIFIILLLSKFPIISI